MAEEDVNGSAPGLQSLNWIGSHTDASAVTYRYLPMTVACKQLQPHFLGEKQYLLSLRKMRLLGDPKPGSASRGLACLSCINQ